MKLRTTYVLRLAIMCIVILVFFKWINIFQSIHLALDASKLWVGLGIVLIGFNNVLKGIRFAFITRYIGSPIPFLRSIFANNISILVGRVSPGRIGEASKIALVGQNTSEMSFCFTLEKIIDFSIVLAIAFLGLSQFSDYAYSMLLFGGGLCLLVLIIVKLDKVLAFIAKRPVIEDRWFSSHLRKIKGSHIFFLILMSLIIRAGPLLLALIVDRALGLSSPIFALIVLYNLAIILGQISAVPGGYGVREAGYTFLISTHLGMDITTAGIAATLITLIDLFAETLGALIGWLGLRLR